MEYKSNPWTIVLAVLLTALIVGGGVYYWQNQQTTDEVIQQDEVADEQEADTTSPPPEIEVTTEDSSESPSDTPPNIDELSAEEERGLHSSIKYVNDGTKYENWIYRFSVVVPSSWGDIHEKVEDGQDPIHQTVRLTAEDDSEHYIQIQVIKTEDKDNPMVIDYPQTYLTGNSVWSFYYTGGGDYAGRPGLEDQKYFDIQEEVNAISESFETF